MNEDTLKTLFSCISAGVELTVRPHDLLNPQCGYFAKLTGRNDLYFCAHGNTPEQALNDLCEMVHSFYKV